MAGEAGTVGTPPAHYATPGGLQPFDVIDAYKLTFFDGNAFKYLARCDKKGSRYGDLKKALHYIEETILRFEADGFVHWSPARRIPKQMHPEAVYRAFGLTGHVAEAVFYLLEWRISNTPMQDIQSAKRYVERAIREEEETHE